MASTYAKLPYIEKIGSDDGKITYLTRIHLTPFRWWRWPRLYLHIFGRPDQDRELHDHPWGFTTVVLWGGYKEISHCMHDLDSEIGSGSLTPTGDYNDDTLTLFSIRRRPATHAHKITKLLAKFVITLVIRDNGRSREWGFWTSHLEKPPHSLNLRTVWTWVQWQDYLGLPKAAKEKY